MVLCRRRPAPRAIFWVGEGGRLREKASHRIANTMPTADLSERQKHRLSIVQAVSVPIAWQRNGGERAGARGSLQETRYNNLCMYGSFFQPRKKTGK